MSFIVVARDLQLERQGPAVDQADVHEVAPGHRVGLYIAHHVIL